MQLLSVIRECLRCRHCSSALLLNRRGESRGDCFSSHVFVTLLVTTFVCYRHRRKQLQQPSWN